MTYSHPQQGRSTGTDQLRKEGGRLLKEMREARGMTQRQLAEKVGIEYYTFIAQIESGRGRIPPERYEAFAKAYGVNPRDFVRTMIRYYDPITYHHLFDAETDPGSKE